MAWDERNDEYLTEFSEQQLEEHDKQIRADAIDAFFLKAIEAYHNDTLDECELCNIERQLKENNNGNKIYM